MPENKPCFVIQVSSGDVWDKIQSNLWNTFKGKLSPLVRVDEAQKRVEFDCCYRDINNLMGKGLAATLVGLAPGEGTNEQKVIARFATLAYRKEFEAAMEKARKTFRDFDYPEDDDGDLGIDGKSARGAADKILGDHQGMVLGNKHTDSHSKEMLLASMDSGDFGKNNVGLMFIEEFSTEIQDQLNAFSKMPAGSDIPPDLLKAIKQVDTDYHLEGNGSFEALVKKAQEKQVKLYGINSNEATAHDDHPLLFGEQRNAQMNKVVKEVMDKAIKDNPGKKFVALCGAAHSNTHEGGIPGIAQMYDAPAVKLGYDGKMVKDPEDKSKRDMPGKVEQHFLEAYVKQLSRTEPDQGRAGHDLREIRTRAFKLAKTLAGKGALDLASATEGDIAKVMGRDEVKKDIAAAIKLKTTRIARKAEAKTLIDAGNAKELKKKLTEYLRDDPAFLSTESSTGESTLLHHAAENRQVDCLKELLDKGANPNAADAKGAAPLHKSPSAETVDALVKAGADIHRPDNDGKTPLHAAVSSGSQFSVVELIRVGAKVNGPDKEGATPLHAAVEAQNGAALTVLLKNGGQPLKADRAGNTVVHAAAAKGNGPLLELVVENLDLDSDPLDEVNAKGETPLLLAIKGGHDELADTLIDDGADVTIADKEQTTALHIAARDGKKALVETLAGKGANLNKRDGAGRTPLHLAAEGGKTDAAKALLVQGAEVNRDLPDGRNELHLAAAKGDRELISALITARTDVTKLGPGGTTPLLAVLANGKSDLAKELLARGASANEHDDDGNSALHLALTGGAKDAVLPLLGGGADLTHRNREGKSVLEQAAQTGGKECVLIQKTATGGWDRANSPIDALFIAEFVEAARAEYQARLPKPPTPANPNAAPDVDARQAAALAASLIPALRTGGQLNLGTFDTLAKQEAKGPAAVAMYVMTESRKGNAGKIRALADDKIFKNADENVTQMTKLLDADPDLIHIEPTLLHKACKWGNDDMVNLLLKRGANVFYQDPDGRTPLHRALEQRMEAEFTTPEGQAAREGRTEDITNRLLDSIPDMAAKRSLVDVQDTKGTTALHLAAWSDHPTCIKKLLTEGAHPDIVDKRGWRPIDVAVGSTKDRSEAMLVQYSGTDTPTLGDPGAPPRNTVEALCAATFCENPEHAKMVRQQLEELYANELLRPVMDICAMDALRPRVSPKTDSDNANVGGVRFFISAEEQVGKLYNAVQAHKAPKGTYDEKVNVLHAGFKTDEKDFAGTLIHEMTHLATRIVYGKDTKPCDGTNQADYIKAIEKDVRSASLLGDGRSESDIRDIVCGRMIGDSYAGIGDKAFLTEFIVGVPQIMAKYGPEAAEKYAPELFNVFSEFKDKCEQFKADPRFDGVRDKLDNAQLEADLEGRKPTRMPDKWLEKNDRPTVDGLMKRIEEHYIVQNGKVKPTTSRSGDPHTIVYDTSVMQIEATDPAYPEFKAKMAAIRTALEKNYSPDSLTAVAADDVKALIKDTVDIAGKTPSGQLEAITAKKTGQWLHKAKRHHLENKVEGNGQKLTSAELAEFVVLKAEDASWAQLKGMGGSEEPDVASKKHVQLTKLLRAKIDGLPEDRQRQILARPQGFIDERVNAVVSAKSQIFYKKAAKQGRDPEHVSVNSALWVKQLATLKK